jgi:hypothetical protein
LNHEYKSFNQTTKIEKREFRELHSIRENYSFSIKQQLLTQLTIQLNFSGRMGNVKQALKLITENSERMGNFKQALKLTTEKLRDVNWAIDFCKDQNEPELCEDLKQSSLDKPCKILIFI